MSDECTCGACEEHEEEDRLRRDLSEAVELLREIRDRPQGISETTWPARVVAFLARVETP